MPEQSHQDRAGGFNPDGPRNHEFAIQAEGGAGGNGAEDA